MNSPIKDIEQDIRDYMNEVYDLKSELLDIKNEKEKQHKKILLGLLEIMDSFETRFEGFKKEEQKFNDETKKWVNKFRMTYKKLARLLKEENVTVIDVSVGQQANPVWHQIIETTQLEGGEENTIREVHQKGYLLKGKLLRESTVTIIKNN